MIALKIASKSMHTQNGGGCKKYPYIPKTPHTGGLWLALAGKSFV
jgi:hypothetical protein